MLKEELKVGDRKTFFYEMINIGVLSFLHVIIEVTIPLQVTAMGKKSGDVQNVPMSKMCKTSQMAKISALDQPKEMFGAKT